MAAPKMGKREAMRLALENAAALIEGDDVVQLFGDALWDEYPDHEQLEIELTIAQTKAVARIRALIAKK